MRLAPAFTQRIAVAAMWIITGLTLCVLAFIIAFILYHGLPNVFTFGQGWRHVLDFLLESPKSMGREGGILPMIVGTLWVTLLAVLLAAPVGVATAIYLTEYTREGRLTAIVRFGADCLAGIPSIIFGLFGAVLFVSLMGRMCVLAGALTLAIMVLPTIIRTSEEAIRAVPRSYRDASYGLGSTRWQMVTQVVLRSALPGIGTGIVLSIGRSISETAAVMFTAGSALGFPQSLFDPTRTLALHFYTLALEGISMPKAYATASVLILAILVINLAAYWLMRRFVAKVS
jgi:phosphate transport system permease protein